MRGSRPDQNIREFSIDDRGMHIGKPFRDVSGIISGHPACSTLPQEMERLSHSLGIGPFDLSNT